MGIRDILLAILVAVGVFLALGKPWRGVLLWVWLSVMNPHRLTYGFMWSAPVAAVAALVTLGSLVFTRDKISLPICAPILFLAGFVAWMSIGLPFSIHPDQVIPQYSKVMKIILMTFVAAAALSSRKHVHYLTWMLVLSLGFYGVKGGLFTLANGGNYMVRGPDGSFIGPNNELALALTMTVPLMRYLQLQEARRWMRNALSGAMLLTAFSILGSHSRGALVAIAAMVAALWWRSNRKLPMLMLIGVLSPMLLLFMPDEWWERMGTIKTYEQDESAMGRINAWWMTWNLAKDRLFGGGFEIYDTHVFGLYAPIPEDVHAAHSIYFQVLGEHGFGGLFFYLCIWFSTWFTIRWVRKHAKARQQQWAVDLASMSEVSLIGYAVGGAFLSLSYFDLPYYLVVMMVVLRYKLFAPGGEYAAASAGAGGGTPAGTTMTRSPTQTTTLDAGRRGG